MLDGTWKPGDIWDGMKEGTVGISAVQRRSRPTCRRWPPRPTNAIIAGTLHPFTGPINKQDGSPWLAAGATAPDGDLLGMNFYVEGIEGRSRSNLRCRCQELIALAPAFDMKLAAYQQ